MAVATEKALQTSPPQTGQYASGWLPQLAVILGLSVIVRWFFPDFATYPTTWIVPLKEWISACFEWLAYDLDFGLFTFRDITRVVSWLLEWPLDLAEHLFHRGFETIGLPPLPWLTVVGLAAIIGHYAGGWRIALVGGLCFFYLALFAVWQPSMQTFALVAVTVPFAVLIGLAVGIAAARNPRIEKVVTPCLDVMQSTPHFAYLVPVVVLFGFGQVPAMIATAIFAIPPMIRCTILGLRTVPSEVIEAGRMAGCTPRQLLWKVELPAARQTVMVGVNQVIMQTLAMVVIASLIGASGLGHNLLLSLNSLKMGKALEQGIAISVIAIGLNQISQALAEKKPVHIDRHAPIWQRRPHLIAVLAFLVASVILAIIAPAFGMLPENWTITTAPFWDAGIKWISVNLYEPLQAFRNFALLYILIPLRNAFLWLPWFAALALVGLVGWRIGGWRLALLVTLLLAFPAVNGFWKPAMVTLYMIGSATVVCVVIGFLLGLFASRFNRVASVLMTICDTLQTFPSFIYLIPVVMLFKTSDVAAITAVIAYATVPMIRYTNLGLRTVPAATKEAAIASGCTQGQLLWKVEMPIALPQIMLGLNQTIMMALFMVAITALIGSQDLGQEINKARSDTDVGRALTAGLSIAFLGIIADRLIGSWSKRRQRELGLV